jgi:hypothetical protein
MDKRCSCHPQSVKLGRRGVWAALFAVCILNQAEGVILLAVVAVPVGLFWIFGRFATKWAAYVDKHWA